jgi:hypothetical protein
VQVGDRVDYQVSLQSTGDLAIEAVGATEEDLWVVVTFKPTGAGGFQREPAVWRWRVSRDQAAASGFAPFGKTHDEVLTIDGQRFGCMGSNKSTRHFPPPSLHVCPARPFNLAGGLITYELTLDTGDEGGSIEASGWYHRTHALGSTASGTPPAGDFVDLRKAGTSLVRTIREKLEVRVGD